MGNWDFLLQKKGDRQWGTAHKSDLTLKTGSYRIAAKGEANMDVAVTIEFLRHGALEDEKPKAQSRAKRTNAKGLLAIVPFTHFRPGQWTITCKSLEPDQVWEQILKLQIKGVVAPKKTFQPLPLPPNPNLFSFEGAFGEPKTDPATTTPPSPDLTGTDSEIANTEALEPEVLETEDDVLDRSLAKLMAIPSRESDAQQQAAQLKAAVAHTLQELDEPTADFDTEEDWADTETAANLLQGSLQELDELLRAELEPIWQEMDRAAQQDAVPQGKQPTPKPVTPPDFLTITPAQGVITWQGDRPVTLAGTITTTKEIPEIYQPAVRQLKLRFELVNPQNAQQQVYVEQHLNNPEFPLDYRQVVAIDPDWKTLAIVGNITLETQEQPPQILATSSLNLVADYQAIAANVRLPETPPEDQALVDAEATSTKPLDLPEPDAFIIAEKVSEPSPTASVLPPKLKHQDRAIAQTPQLPDFMQTSAQSPIGEAVLEETDFTAIVTDTVTDNVATDVEGEQELLALPGGDVPVEIPKPTAGHGETEVDAENIPYPFVLTPEEQAAADEPTIVKQEPEASAVEDRSPPDPDHPNLDWNSRFFQRLNTMATDSPDSSWLEESSQEQSPEEEAPVAIVQEEIVVEASLPEQPVAEAVPPTMEIVVDSLWDEQEQNQTDPTMAASPMNYDASGLPYPPEMMAVVTATPEDIQSAQPIPEPILGLSKTEYRATERAVVRIMLPAYPDRLYVKLWLQDRQTRNLLAGPLQLTDFTPNADGSTETLTQMTIPQGATEIRFEAIAINPRLQQESRKVGLDRQVIPNSFSEMNWDDLEV